MSRGGGDAAGRRRRRPTPSPRRGARLRFARLGWVRFLGLLDATSGRVTGHEFSPALRMTVPIFNRNQGGIARAEAELEQLERRRQTVHNQIVLDVRSAYARYRQARAELDFLRSRRRGRRSEAAIRRGRDGVQRGERHLPDRAGTEPAADRHVRPRGACCSADLRRAWAELERGVGRRLLPRRPHRTRRSPPMNYRSGILIGVAATLARRAGRPAPCWWIVAPNGRRRPASAAPPGPGTTVAKPFKEDSPPASPDRRGRGGPAIGGGRPRSRGRPMRRVRVYGGEVTVPPGRAVVVSAPARRHAAGRSGDHAGARRRRASRARPCFQLLPLLDARGRANLTAAEVDAEGQVKSAKEQLKAANISPGPGQEGHGRRGRRQRDGGRRRRPRRTIAAQAARRRDRPPEPAAQGARRGRRRARPRPIALAAPASGVLRTVSALAGQTVPAGALLFEVMDLEHRVGACAGVRRRPARPRRRRHRPTVGHADRPAGRAQAQPATPVDGPARRQRPRGHGGPVLRPRQPRRPATAPASGSASRSR